MENKFGNVIQNILKAYVSSNPNSAPLFYQMEDMKRRQEEDERARQWQDWERNVQKEQYEQSQADRQRNTFQVTPEMQEKYSDTTFGFRFNPTDQTVFEQSEETTTPELRSLAKLSGIEIPENYTKSFETTKPVYGSVMTDDIKMAENERQGDLIAQLKAKQAADKAAEDERRWNEEMKAEWAKINKPSGTKKDEPSREQVKLQNSLLTSIGDFRTPNDAKADLQKRESQLVEQLGSYAAYQAVIEDVDNPNHWKVVNNKQVGSRWQPGKGSPIARLLGGSPRMLEVASSNNGSGNQSENDQGNKTSNQVAHSAEVKKAIQTHGSIDKAIRFYKSGGLSDNNPLMKALLKAKKGKNPKDLLAANKA